MQNQPTMLLGLEKSLQPAITECSGKSFMANVQFKPCMELVKQGRCWRLDSNLVIRHVICHYAHREKTIKPFPASKLPKRLILMTEKLRPRFEVDFKLTKETPWT